MLNKSMGIMKNKVTKLWSCLKRCALCKVGVMTLDALNLAIPRWARIAKGAKLDWDRVSSLQLHGVAITCLRITTKSKRYELVIERSLRKSFRAVGSYDYVDQRRHHQRNGYLNASVTTNMLACITSVPLHHIELVTSHSKSFPLERESWKPGVGRASANIVGLPNGVYASDIRPLRSSYGASI
jgi:hypothetical protein